MNAARAGWIWSLDTSIIDWDRKAPKADGSLLLRCDCASWCGEYPAAEGTPEATVVGGQEGGADEDMAMAPPPLENEPKVGDVNGESLRDLDAVLLAPVSIALPFPSGEVIFERLSNHALRSLLVSLCPMEM